MAVDIIQETEITNERSNPIPQTAPKKDDGSATVDIVPVKAQYPYAAGYALRVTLSGNAPSGGPITAIYDGTDENRLVDVVTDSEGVQRLAVDLRGAALDFASDPIFDSTIYKKTTNFDETVFTVTANDAEGKDIFITSLTFGGTGRLVIRFYNSTTSEVYLVRRVEATSSIQHIFPKAIRIKNGETFKIDITQDSQKNEDYEISYDGFQFLV